MLAAALKMDRRVRKSQCGVIDNWYPMTLARHRESSFILIQQLCLHECCFHQLLDLCQLLCIALN